MNPVETRRGTGPVILSIPHAGLDLPAELRSALNAAGRELADTDWHVDRLYDGLSAETTIVRATFHRYVIDANRDPAGKSLYPGQNTTALCPTTDFDGAPIYREGAEPDAAEIERRRAAFHGPYHAALRAEVARAREAYGIAVLYDCHSIRSRVPFLFEGVLPDFNIGTHDGAACAPALAEAVRDVCAGAAGYSCVLNGRFKGGWTTRHYGAPADGVHAIQMELAQSTYMEEAPPFAYDSERADRLRAQLKRVLEAVSDFARAAAPSA